MLFYVEYNKEPTLSANNCSETSSSGTCSFSITSFIRNRKSALKSLFYTNYKLVILQCRLQCRARFVPKTEQIHTFLYIVRKLKGIFKKSKESLPSAFGNMYSAYLFFSLWLPNFSVPAFKNFSQNPIKHGLTYQSFFALYFHLDVNHLPSLLLYRCC